MRRVFWLALGVTVGAVLMRKLTRFTDRAAQALTPSGIAQTLSDSAGRTLDAARDFLSDVRAGTRERETELREGAGLDAGDPAAGGPTGAAAPDSPRAADQTDK